MALSRADDLKTGIASGVLLVGIDTLCDKWGRYAIGTACLAALYRFLLTPKQQKTMDHFENRSSRFKALRQKHFPPGFPNTWHAVCNAADIAHGNVKSISALGTEMVAFRGSDGKAAVLDAFCPHMGAHLGFGGQVIGNTLQCPFHGWSFDGSGTCQRIPYTNRLTEELKEGAKIKAYERSNFHLVRCRGTTPTVGIGGRTRLGRSGGAW
eukprot:Skav226289  [mRNA]  locus=scaffold3301:187474:188103:+ [translate_table: standard]